MNMYMIIVSLLEMSWVEIAKASKPQNYTLEAKFTIPKMRTYVKSSPIYVNFNPICWFSPLQIRCRRVPRLLVFWWTAVKLVPWTKFSLQPALIVSSCKIVTSTTLNTTHGKFMPWLPHAVMGMLLVLVTCLFSLKTANWSSLVRVSSSVVSLSRSLKNYLRASEWALPPNHRLWTVVSERNICSAIPYGSCSDEYPHKSHYQQTWIESQYGYWVRMSRLL